MEYNYITCLMMSASYYLIVMFDNYVPRQQLSSFSMTRPFLSLWRVWLPRLVISLVNCFAACVLFSLCQTQTALYRHVIFKTSDHPCSLWPEVSAVQSRQVIRLGIKLTPGLSRARLLKCNLLNSTCSFGCSSSCNRPVVAPPSPHVTYCTACICILPMSA